MLILTREKNQVIVIGEGLVRIMVVDIRGDCVRLGIEAPKDIRVDREEIFERRKRERREQRTDKD